MDLKSTNNINHTQLQSKDMQHSFALQVSNLSKKNKENDAHYTTLDKRDRITHRNHMLNCLCSVYSLQLKLPSVSRYKNSMKHSFRAI